MSFNQFRFGFKTQMPNIFRCLTLSRHFSSQTFLSRTYSLCTSRQYNSLKLRYHNTDVKCMRHSSLSTASNYWYRDNKPLHTVSVLQLYNQCNSTKRRYGTKASARLSLKDENFREYLKSLVVEYDEGCQQVGSGGATGKLVKRVQQLAPVVEIFQTLENKYQEAEELIKLQSDEEMKAMAAEDHRVCLIEIDELEQSLVNSLVTEEAVDNCDIILEVTNGVGGVEAMLFTGEMFQMYQNFAAYMGWNFESIEIDRNETGAVRFASAAIRGNEVYRLLKFEGGVHRVQRVPKTEKTGRVHTSTISVAVYPQPTEVDIVINTKDLRVDTYRASGKGGQHVNTTDSAVRIVHLPTGIKAECQEGRSQISNKQIAMMVLKSRMYEKQIEDQNKEVKTQRKLQVGSKSRSEKQRTYNFGQDRITDHRLGKTLHNIEQFMQGGPNLEDLIYSLLEEAKFEVLIENIDNFIDEKKKKVKKAK